MNYMAQNVNSAEVEKHTWRGKQSSQMIRASDFPTVSHGL